MKKLILMLAFCASVSGAYAQKTVKVENAESGKGATGNGSGCR